VDVNLEHSVAAQRSGAGGSSARDRLLESVIEHVAGHGFADLSLRQLAEAVGTSHRMLIYHFGSKEQLQAAIVATIEARTRALATEMAAADDDAPPQPVGDQLRAMWAEIADPRNHAYERLFFELYGQGLHGRPHTKDFIDGVVTDWVEPLARIQHRNGVPLRQARAEVRLGLAVMRGLLLDLLATGDRAGVDAAFEQFVSLVESR
jgi:AcrR family transcriptional regulator